jgi:hypothetical protein
MTAPTFDREYRTVDKTEWGPGPWQDEPDKAQWIDPATGLDCLLVRNGGGALCGYVGLPPEHPWHGKDYGQCLTRCGDDFCYEHSPGSAVCVHGGLTFSAGCANTDDESRHICHVPLPGRPHDVWWFGFDCAHSGDESPAYARYGVSIMSGEYRDVEYVRGECADLARQLAAVQAIPA